MAFHKHALISIVLLAISGILFGCGDSTVAPRVTTEAPIVAPTNVTAHVMSSGDVMISWDASTQLNLKGYNVYRFDLENYQVGRLTPSPQTQNSYTDHSAQRNVNYEYRVTSVSVKGTESGYSTVAVIVPPDNATRKDPKKNME
jgi:fibronectin type 3 domain-containing protein